MKIVVLDGNVLNPGDLSWKGFESLGDFTQYDFTPPEETINRIENAEIIITNKTKITKDVIDQSPNLKYIGLFSTGYDVVDIAEAKNRDIPVANVPAYSTQAVAQLVFAFILEICHNVGAHSQSVFSGQWQNSTSFSYWNFPLIELAGKTLGIVGYGEIGQTVARIAVAMGLNVIAYNPRPKDVPNNPAIMVTLEEIYRNSDIISLHAPMFPETKEMINKSSIAQMKDNAIIINTARGGIINEQDLCDALNSGKLYAAGLDVVSAEPISHENPLLKAKNCFITPHIAWAPHETRQRLMNISVSNVKAFLDGTPTNVVNK